MEEAGFYLTEDNAIYYVDTNGLEYHRDSSLDPATVPYVQCDQGIYYFQVAAARVQSAKPVQDVGHELEEKKYEQQDVVSGDICHDEQLVYHANASMDMPAADHTQSSQEGIYDYQNRAHYTTPVAACEKGQETDEYYQPNSSIDETDYDSGMEYYPQSQHEPSSHAHGDGLKQPQAHSESRRKSHNSKADEKRKKRGGRSPTPRQSTETSIESHRVDGEKSQQDKKTRSRSDPTRLLATAESERPKRPTRVKSTSGLPTEEDTEDQHGKGGAKSPAGLNSRQHAGGERRHSGKTGRRTVSRKGSRRNVMAGEDRDGERGEKSKRTSLSPVRRSGSKRNILAGAKHVQSMRNLQGRDCQHGERSKGASPSPARHSSAKRNGLAGTRHAQSMRHLSAAGAGREPRRKLKPSLSKTLSRENVNKPSKDRLHELTGDNFSKANAPAKAAGRAGDRGKARAGMTRQDRASMRCLVRKHITPAGDRMPQTSKEKEPTPVEQAIAEELAEADRIKTARIKELEAVVQSLQKQITEEEHAKQATTGSATIDGILVDGKMAVNAACEAGKVAANVGLATAQVAVGATTLAANVGKVTAQVAVGTTSLVAKTAVGTTSLVAKTAVNTAIEARKFASNAGLAATQAATDALGLASKAASSPLAA